MIYCEAVSTSYVTYSYSITDYYYSYIACEHYGRVKQVKQDENRTQY